MLSIVFDCLAPLDRERPPSTGNDGAVPAKGRATRRLLVENETIPPLVITWRLGGSSTDRASDGAMKKAVGVLLPQQVAAGAVIAATCTMDQIEGCCVS